jgi:drug/metabolite transporter (DMT)-like permease
MRGRKAGIRPAVYCFLARFMEWHRKNQDRLRLLGSGVMECGLAKTRTWPLWQSAPHSATSFQASAVGFDRNEKHCGLLWTVLTGFSPVFMCDEPMFAIPHPAAFRSEPAPLTGMVLAAAAFALLTAVDTVFKLMAEGHPAYQILLVNGGFSIIPIIGWALFTGGLERLHTERLWLHVGRGSISVLSAFCAIYAYSRLPLADFYAIVFSGPLIVTLLSSFWLGEKVDRNRWLAIGIGFLGVLLVTHSFTSNATFEGPNARGRLAALLSVFGYAFSIDLLRRMRFGESNIAFSFYGYMSAVLIGGAFLLILGGPPMGLSDFAHLALSGLLGGISSICLMTAYYRSPVALIAPFQYTQIIWGALAGWFLWHQVPSHSLIAGAAIVALSGLYVIYRELRMAEEKKSA